MTARLSISLPDDVAAAIRELAESADSSVSTWIAKAAVKQAEEQRRFVEGLQAVHEYEVEYGTYTEDEMAQARAELIAAGVLRVADAGGQRAS